MLSELDLLFFNAFYSLAGQLWYFDHVIVIAAEVLPYGAFGAVIVMAYYAWQKQQPAEVIGYTLAIIGSGIARGIAQLIKMAYYHPRPGVTLDFVPLFPETSYSFPSGHAITFFALAMAVYMINKKFGIILFAVAMVISSARIMAGVHWPSDIIAGATCGIGIGYFFQSTCLYFRRKRSILLLE